MIDALIAGRLYGAPKQGTGKTGNTYTTAKLKAAAGHGETLLCSGICFDDKAQAALLALDDGDSIAVSGALTPKGWSDDAVATRPGQAVVSQDVLPPSLVTRNRADAGAGERDGRA